MPDATYIPWGRAVDILTPVLSYSKTNPQDRTRLDAILTAINNAVWRQGGVALIDVFKVNVLPGGVFWAPPGYDAMQAINIEDTPQSIHDRFYEFNHNGPGSGKWGSVVTRQLGRFASMVNTDKKFTVGVAAFGPEEKLRVHIEGRDDSGDVITTWQVQSGTTVKIPGVVFTPSANMEVSDAMWSTVSRIRKTESQGHAEVWAFPDGDKTKGYMIADLPAGQGLDNQIYYTKYALGAGQQCCQWPCVTGLFRRAQPQGPSDSVLVTSVSTLIPLARGAKQLLFGDPAVGRGEIAAALEDVAVEQMVSEPNAVQRPEVDIGAVGLGDFYQIP